ncbi:hydrogen peroxide-inducible genes activator [Cognatiyoonia sp. IB215446]|uniref:hydrogen peroxide-inducible genes activator n=1 Tax=Cognatiyoonia sp. IB215446 TaxID=3097355 RepID=UPI002A14716F|nr:hydrogen peroxide-inducible genes activator [Cognatiyoonia sp. IB215446]MDX8349093.1 hydrogen peroxide-inducible genes activator [Cognatiyoonia sp. IB215446]
MLPSLRQLRYLIALAEARHFRKAAETLGISQPSLSLQISNLEALLSVRLVERGRGPVTLTPEGREVVTRARRAVDEVRGIVDMSAHIRGGMGGTIRLGTTPTIGPYLLPFVVERLHAQYPDLRLYIRESPAPDLRNDLIAGHHDVILTQLPEPGADLADKRLFREPFVLAVASDHPLAQSPTVTEDALAGQTILSLGPDHAMHAQIAALCQAHGALLARDYEGTSLDAIRQMVGMGMGVACLPRLYARSEIDGRSSNVTVIPFQRNVMMRAIGLVWRVTSRADMFERLSQTIMDAARQDLRDGPSPILVD